MKSSLAVQCLHPPPSHTPALVIQVKCKWFNIVVILRYLSIPSNIWSINDTLTGLVNVSNQIQSMDLNGSDGGENSRSPSHAIAIPSGISLHFKRPIFPNLPYSPMSSPSNVRRRCPLKQSRHVSIEKTGQYIQLNQYLLKEPIGQVKHCITILTISFTLLAFVII